MASFRIRGEGLLFNNEMSEDVVVGLLGVGRWGNRWGNADIGHVMCVCVSGRRGQRAATSARRCIVVVSYPYFTVQPSVKGTGAYTKQDTPVSQRCAAHGAAQATL